MTSLNWPGATYLTVVVHQGDTVSQIADRYDVSTNTLVAMNNIDDRDAIYPGETLRVPALSHATRDAVLRDATSKPAEPVATPTPAPTRMVAVTSFVLPSIWTKPEDKPAPIVPDMRPATSGEFEWPVAGQIISAFGASRTGEYNDGINIAAALGTPIHAAAAGTVTYAGNELKGYGNLILIRHDDGYVTAYAHAQSISVNRGDRVEKGQIIGTAGETGDVASPQLHFEIRRGVHPVDPRPLLMASSS